MTARDKVINMRELNPCATLKEIGDKYGITKERVRQILNKEGLATRGLIIRKLCPQCGGVVKNKNSIYCSAKCLTIHKRISAECSYCGKLFTVYAHDIIRRIKKNITGKYFCSNDCRFNWFGEGWWPGVNRKGRPRTYNYTIIKNLYINGYTDKEIIKITGGTTGVIQSVKRVYSLPNRKI